jgi:hypothetical protein
MARSKAVRRRFSSARSNFRRRSPMSWASRFEAAERICPRSNQNVRSSPFREMTRLHVARSR